MQYQDVYSLPNTSACQQMMHIRSLLRNLDHKDQPLMRKCMNFNASLRELI